MTRPKAVLVTMLLALGTMSLVTLAVTRPLWLLALPAAALLATAVAGVALFVRARRAARRSRPDRPSDGEGIR